MFQVTIPEAQSRCQQTNGRVSLSMYSACCRKGKYICRKNEGNMDERLVTPLSIHLFLGKRFIPLHYYSIMWIV